MRLDLIEDLVRGGPPLEEDHGRAHAEGEHQVRPRRVPEEELGDREADVVLAVASDLERVGLGGVGEVALDVDAGLGLAGGAGGEEPASEVVGAGGLDVLELGARLTRGHGLLEGHRALELPPHHVGHAAVARAGEGRGELLRDGGMDEDRRGLRVLEVVAVVLLLQERIDHREDAAGPQGSEPRLDELEPVGEDEEHALLGSEPVPAQGRAERPHARGDLSVRLRSVPHAHRVLVRAPLVEVAVQVVRAEVEALGQLVEEDPVEAGALGRSRHARDSSSRLERKAAADSCRSMRLPRSAVAIAASSPRSTSTSGAMLRMDGASGCIFDWKTSM